MMDAPALRKVAEEYRRLGWADAGPAITRFAPSPTGELHLGHVAHALWVWGVAAALDARVIIRMEDHDRTRCTPEFEASILADLDWLGFAPDTASLASLRTHPSPFRQSDTPEHYRDAFHQLVKATRVYNCHCTRSMLGPPDAAGERFYPGTCRERGISRDALLPIRALIPDGAVIFNDLRLGAVTQHPARDQGDVVIRDALGQWTYQFCVVVDDLRHGVNVVVRGEDLLSSTGRQLMLGKLLGRTMPFVTVHHPLVLSPEGEKLSKRDRSETVRAMRERGMTAEEVIERAWGVGGIERR